MLLRHTGTTFRVFSARSAGFVSFDPPANGCAVQREE